MWLLVVTLKATPRGLYRNKLTSKLLQEGFFINDTITKEFFDYIFFANPWIVF